MPRFTSEQRRKTAVPGGFITEIQKLAPHVEEIARALGDKLSEEEIAEELQKYVDVYRLSIPMAKRTIVKKYGGDAAGFSPGFQRKLAELRPNEPNVDFVAKVLSANPKEITAKGEKKNIIYGLLGDETTTIPYTAWEVEGLELSKGEVISVKGAYTKEYQGKVQVNFGNRVSIKKEDPGTIGDIQVAQGPPKIASAAKGGATDATVTGVIIEVREGSGLIMRCPECKRALQKGTCKVHGRVEGYPDLRVKAILDDGSGAVSAVMGRELTEKLTGTTLDECMEKAKQAMNFEVVKDAMEEQLTFRIATVTGNVTSDAYGLSMIVREADLKVGDVRPEVDRLLVELEGDE